MKKLLSLLSVLTISGTAVPTTIAASSYKKQEELNNNINYSQINSLENLNRNKRQEKSKKPEAPIPIQQNSIEILRGQFSRINVSNLSGERAVNQYLHGIQNAINILINSLFFLRILNTGTGGTNLHYGINPDNQPNHILYYLLLLKIIILMSLLEQLIFMYRGL